MSFLVAEKLQTDDALSGFRVVTNGGCPFCFQRSYRRRVPFWFQRSYRWRMPFQVSEELLTENALNGFRGVTDGECP